jgi:hypothetical protein
MPYFNTRDVAAISISAALWGVLNSLFSPIFFRMFGLPFLCDLIGFSALTIAVWWVKRVGAASMVGLIATLINFLFNPGAVHFLGFTAASIVFDCAAWVAGYERAFKWRILGTFIVVVISTASAAVAGLMIGTLFMDSRALARWGGVLGWAGLHAVGGIMGGTIGGVLVNAISARGIHFAKRVGAEAKG